MEFTIEEKVNFPRELVYTTLRDKFPELAPYLPNIKKIEVVQKKKLKKGVHYRLRWYADYKIPGIVKKFIKEEHLTWYDNATWIDSEYACEWKFEPVFFTEYVNAHGRNEFIEDGPERTRIVLNGILEVDVASHPLVPRLLAGRVRKEIERLALLAIKPNLKRLARALNDYLKDRE